MESPLSFKPKFSSSLVRHARVIHALMLRDIKTRVGASYFGFLFGMAVPLVHIGALLLIYTFMGRRSALGTDAKLFLASAILPFVVWSYTHQKTMQSFNQNRALTYFPIVGFVDILIARMMVEILNSTLIVCVVSTVLILVGVDLFIFDPPSALFTLLMAFFLGASTGLVFGLTAILLPIFTMIGFVIIPLYYATSGVFFIPDAIPEIFRYPVSFFPLSHIVDFGRQSIYPGYITSYPNLFYVAAVIIGNFLLGFTMERFLRPQLTTK